jgi:hypothetical protein
MSRSKTGSGTVGPDQTITVEGNTMTVTQTTAGNSNARVLILDGSPQKNGDAGVLSSIVAQRTREVGVRLALGASAVQIIRTVVAEMARCVAIGLALGLPIGWALSRGFASLFFHVRPNDLWVYVTVAALLAVVGFAAAFLPARRASAVDPLVVLRAE